MKISVIGTGYVGLVTGTCFADMGNDVICVDIDEEKIEKLKNGVIPIYEPGLRELVEKNSEAGRLHFTTDIEKVVGNSELIFLCVGTPPKESGSADLKYVYEAAREIAQNLNGYKLIISKSTVPVGTNGKIKKIIGNYFLGEFGVASNPEFLREGSAVEDFLNPERIIIGINNERDKKILEKLYQNFNCPKIFTNIESAEMIKYASNAFLATKISFINEIANICEVVGADVCDVAKGMGMDKRIGPDFLKAGIGYGGSCFPKDIRALHQISGVNGYQFQLLKSVIEVNNTQRWYFFRKIKNILGELEGKKIAIWGLAFKPDTDDIRESVSLEIIDKLLDEGARVSAYDPMASQKTKVLFPEVEYCENHFDPLDSADALLLITEWEEFREADLSKVKNLMKSPLIFDGRNIYCPKKMKKMGFEYFGMGRPNL